MQNRILYHGSNVAVSNPKILCSGFYKDFGYGFYCTEIKKQAVRWSLNKKNNHIISKFEYVPNNDLKVLNFESITDDWLDFVVECRRGTAHNYDIVEGAMADDTIWNFVENFAAGEISRAAFMELVKFKYPTHQIVFCTENSLRCLRFIEEENILYK